MQPTANCAVVIPCLNEAEAVLPLIAAVRLLVPQVIVVDDGSRDATAALATQAGAEVVRHERTRGKGVSLNAGWRRASERGFEWALCLDGDGQHSAEDIPAFLSAMAGGDADLVVGNRFANAERMPWLRRRVNEWMSRKLSEKAGMKLPDSQCGFRLMRLSAWRTLSLRADHFEIESEVLLAFIAGGYKVRFVPVRTIYAGERSKINPVFDTWRWWRWWRGRKIGQRGWRTEKCLW